MERTLGEAVILSHRVRPNIVATSFRKGRSGRETADWISYAGCESGGGVSCTGKDGVPKQAFLGVMAYNRLWFHKDLLAVTLGGGLMNNPGRYLTLLPPINGADAISGSAYFTANPGDKAHMWDATFNVQYMPKQYITWWMEAGYRHSDVPYWSGRGGITPPGGNNGLPLIASGGVNQLTACNYILAGAAALGVGGELIPPEALRARKERQIRELACRFIGMVKDARAQKTGVTS